MSLKGMVRNALLPPNWCQIQNTLGKETKVIRDWARHQLVKTFQEVIQLCSRKVMIHRLPIKRSQLLKWQRGNVNSYMSKNNLREWRRQEKRSSVRMLFLKEESQKQSGKAKWITHQIFLTDNFSQIEMNQIERLCKSKVLVIASIICNLEQVQICNRDKTWLVIIDMIEMHLGLEMTKLNSEVVDKRRISIKITIQTICNIQMILKIMTLLKRMWDPCHLRSIQSNLMRTSMSNQLMNNWILRLFNSSSMNRLQIKQSNKNSSHDVPKIWAQINQIHPKR